jgi:creatinine amidohydrolase/Fe(II)-dependent formamide hydrolase-like protein
VPKSRDPLAALEVIDRLEVGPVRLEPRRLTAPHVITQGKKTHALELTYKFEEDVFFPGELESENLAAMMGVQVALNYGLLCKEMVFRGPFDAHDRRFLEEMARNTACEIYVNKFLHPNPFLVGDAANLPTVKRADYLRARLVFPDAEPQDLRPWVTDRGRCAVLSSGGKESLLSFGLLREIGADVHPIFINESGRHWYTALNSHRHLAATHPQTARVWTNCDRLFNGMLRLLPFVRKDHADVRADIYPVRLWTVAVFLFGALPLMRKRGVARLVIGDEHDTTVRRTHEGISHYDGLYDQSRYFDDALTRHFRRKAWGVSQFSVLRPCSEMLIEKVLGTRYPELMATRVSCHAAHTEGERVHPCGKCEKCRRVVGMLTALDLDPRVCGYSDVQIAACLEALTKQSTKQEAEVAQHMLHLLGKSGAIPPGKGRTSARPEVMKLRFHRERSPMDSIPPDLRTPLHRILKEHADGAVRRHGRTWRRIDPLSAEVLAPPYRFESHPQRTSVETNAMPNDSHLLAHLTWPEAQRRFKETDVALLPVGATEQHGHHLPLDVDSYDAEHLCDQVARRCGDPRPLVLPLIPYGVSYHHENFSGTIAVSPETLSRLVHEIGMQAVRNGVTKLVIINGHGGNGPALHFAAQMINRDAHIFVCVDSGETSDADIDAIAETSSDVHAGEIETSTTLSKRPELVKMDRAKRSVPKFSSQYLDFSSKRGVDWYARTDKISKSGVMGDATKGTKEKGDRIWEVMIHNLVEFVEDLKRMSLDEIHQRGKL